MEKNYDYSILKKKTLWLFDMDGTIYEGERVFEGTNPLLKTIEKMGGRYMFLTNNSSKSVMDYVEKLNRMGIVSTKENFFTSTQATILYLKENYPGMKVYAQGTKSFVKELREGGICVTEEKDPDVGVVLVGFDTELTFEKLTKTVELLRIPDIPYIAANPDFVCPVEGGFVPDCGSMCIGIKYATGREPFVIGKPKPTMIDIVCKNLNVPKEEAVLIGDRLYTDIASGLNAGITTVLVLSGEATLEDLKTTEFIPSLVIEDVGRINEELKRNEDTHSRRRS